MSSESQGGQDFDDFKGELEDAERRVAREIEPGTRALTIAILVFVLLVTLVLPHTGGARGLDVLVGSDAAVSNGVTLPSRLFTGFALVFGIGFSMLALVTRRWALAWIAMAGTSVGSFLGMLAVWSRQTAPEQYPGPGIGLVIGWLAVIMLAYNWARVVLTRTALQLASEEERRRSAAQGQHRGVLDSFGGDEETGPTKS